VLGNEIAFSCMRIAPNIVAILDTLQSKSTGNGGHFYEVNFDVARNNTFSNAQEGMIKMALYGDVHFKQCVVTKFLVSGEGICTKHSQAVKICIQSQCCP
jgi:hypothetical protein